MKSLTLNHKDIEYEFQLLESCSTVEVIKAGKLTYKIDVSGQPFLCSCPGNVYHQKCWHVDEAVPLLMLMPRIDTPLAEIVEEAGRMKYG